jgi:hypothetical protein
MQITLDKNTFSKKFLSPINKISDKGIFVINKKGVECLATTGFDQKEQTIILFTRYETDFVLDEGVEEIKLNVPDVNKLINVFSFLSEEAITLTVENNNLSYSSDKSNTSFKYHLLEDGVLEPPSVKIENVYNMGFDFETEIQNDIFKKVLKGASFADKTNKIYLYTKNNSLYGILTDESLQNIDTVEFELSDCYKGEDIKNKVPLNLQVYRVISSLNFEKIKVKINIKKGIVMFEIKENNFLLQYIVTALVK